MHDHKIEQNLKTYNTGKKRMKKDCIKPGRLCRTEEKVIILVSKSIIGKCMKNYAEGYTKSGYKEGN